MADATILRRRLGLLPIACEDVERVRVTRDFLAHREQRFATLLDR